MFRHALCKNSKQHINYCVICMAQNLHVVFQCHVYWLLVCSNVCRGNFCTFLVTLQFHKLIKLLVVADVLDINNERMNRYCVQTVDLSLLQGLCGV